MKHTIRVTTLTKNLRNIIKDLENNSYNETQLNKIINKIYSDYKNSKYFQAFSLGNSRGSDIREAKTFLPAKNSCEDLDYLQDKNSKNPHKRQEYVAYRNRVNYVRNYPHKWFSVNNIPTTVEKTKDNKDNTYINITKEPIASVNQSDVLNMFYAIFIFTNKLRHGETDLPFV